MKIHGNPRNNKILLIDDHPLFREGLKSIIKNKKNYHIVGEACTGNDGIKAALKLKPNIIILDISLPDMSGISLLPELLKSIKHVKVLILSMHSRISYVSRAFKAGALGYLVKESAAEDLITALDTISQGEFFIDRSLSHELIIKLINSPDESVYNSDEAYNKLSSREQEIMRLLVEGMQTKEIAHELNISPKTVESHRINIFTKLEILNTVELVKYAAKIGLIEIED